MKTEINIINGKAKIILTCESEFEIDLVEKIKDSKLGYEANTKVLTDYNYHSHENHRIEIELNEYKNQTK